MASICYTFAMDFSFVPVTFAQAKRLSCCLSYKADMSSVKGLNIIEQGEERKSAHIELAANSQTAGNGLDRRFSYEPLFAAHPSSVSQSFPFLGKTMQAPIWVSSMTGGTEAAYKINHNLAQACAEFGLGMGLGSCRVLLEGSERFPDFDLRPVMGNAVPFFANLGIAQLEELIDNNELQKVSDLVGALQADGLIVHVNPMQEFFQPEGDVFRRPPLETILAVLDFATFPVIVKEVGQGFGPQSIETLLQLPLAALDFGAYGGTNFSLLERLRDSDSYNEVYEPLVYTGHTAFEMTDFVNAAIQKLGDKVQCKHIIVSGGIKNFADGFYCIQKLQMPAVYGQAYELLKRASGSYADLRNYIQKSLEAYRMAEAYLRIK